MKSVNKASDNTAPPERVANFRIIPPADICISVSIMGEQVSGIFHKTRH